MRGNALKCFKGMHQTHTFQNNLFCHQALSSSIFCLQAHILTHFYLMHPRYDSQSRPGTQYKSQSYHNNHTAHNVDSSNCSFTRCKH